MMKNALEETMTELSEISLIADKIYSELVGNYFDEVIELKQRFDFNQNPVTDDELEKILTVLPLRMFKISEALSKATLTNQIAKIKAKEKGEDASVEYKLTAAVYESVMLRIDKERSCCRELIMASKKIWDSRRAAEEAAGIRTDVGKDPKKELPDYDKTYIK